MDSSNALLFRSARLTPPPLGVPADWRPSKGVKGFRGPMGLLARNVSKVAALFRTPQWQPATTTTEIIKPITVKELVSSALLKARRRLLEALRLEDAGSMSKAKQRKYVLPVKRQLLHVEGKPPRNYQAPLPSRTLALVPFWGAWNHVMKGHALSTKGLTPQARAELMGSHAMATSALGMLRGA